MLRRAVVILGLLAVSLSSARAQSERICPVPDPCPLLKQSKAVFVGRDPSVPKVTLTFDKGECVRK